MRLILHIGMPKTGTTSIQESLHINRETLSRNGVYVPALLGKRNHRRFSMIFERPQNDKWSGLWLGNLSPDKTQAMVSENLRLFEEEVKLSNSHHSFVISSEQMSWRYESSEIQALAKVCQEHFSRIDVIIFLRPQWTAIPSRYWLSLRTSLLSKSFARWLEEDAFNHWQFDYAKLLDVWTSNFPEAKLSPIVMSGSGSFDSVEAFYRDALGLQTSVVNILPVDRKNESGSRFDVVALRTLNTFVSIWLRLKTSRELGMRAVRAKRRLNRMKPLLKWFGPYKIKKSQSRHIADHYQQSNRVLSAKYFSGNRLFEVSENG